MGHYIVHFTKGGAKLKTGLARQARDLLRLGLWGVPPTAQLKMNARRGDGVLVAIGAPDRLFVGDAVVAFGYHRFSEEEAARFPSTLSYDIGLSLTQVRVWPRALPVMAVWPKTGAAVSNPGALWFGTPRKAHHPLDAGPVVPTAVEDHDLARRWKMRQVALDVHLGLLTVGRRGERDHPEYPRAHPLGDPLDHPALPGRSRPSNTTQTFSPSCTTHSCNRTNSPWSRASSLLVPLAAKLSRPPADPSPSASFRSSLTPPHSHTDPRAASGR